MRVLPGFYRGVVRLFHWYFNEVMVLQECYLGVTKVLPTCHKVVTLVFQWSDKQECNIRSYESRVTCQELQV